MTHQRTKHIERKFHLVREIAKRWDIAITKIICVDNIVDPSTKPWVQKCLKNI